MTAKCNFNLYRTRKVDYILLQKVLFTRNSYNEYIIDCSENYHCFIYVKRRVIFSSVHIFLLLCRTNATVCLNSLSVAVISLDANTPLDFGQLGGLPVDITGHGGGGGHGGIGGHDGTGGHGGAGGHGPVGHGSSTGHGKGVGVIGHGT